MRRGGQALGLHLRLGGHDALNLADEPGVELAGGVDLVDAESGAEGLGHRQDAVGRGRREGRDMGLGRAVAGDRQLVQPGKAGLKAAQALLQRLGE